MKPDTILNKVTVNKYYLMSTEELEQEASKWKIGNYFDGMVIRRENIIQQLIEKDNANNARYAIIVSVVALIISIIALLV